MTQQAPRYLIYEAFVHFQDGHPVPVDLFMDLKERGVSPEKLHRAFSRGVEPPLSDAELLAVTEWDYADTSEEGPGSNVLPFSR